METRCSCIRCNETNISLYVDGKLDGFVEGAVRYEAIARRQVKNIILGRQYQDLANPINAAYDDLQLWDKALSKTEIENLAKIIVNLQIGLNGVVVKMQQRKVIISMTTCSQYEDVLVK